MRVDTMDQESSPNKLYADIAHPINQECRDMIQAAVIAEYEQELLRSKEPVYVSRYDDDYSDTRPPKTTAGTSSNEDTLETSAEKTFDRQPPPQPHFDSAPAREPVQDTAQRDKSDDQAPKNHDSKDAGDGFGAGILDD